MTQDAGAAAVPPKPPDAAAPSGAAVQPPKPPEQINLEKIEDRLPNPKTIPLPLIGLQIVWGLIGLIALALILVVVLACKTHPDLEHYTSIWKTAVPDTSKAMTAKEMAAEFREATTVWFSQITTLIQLLIVSLLVPTLSTVIGYIFGQRQKSE